MFLFSRVINLVTLSPFVFAAPIGVFFCIAGLINLVFWVRRLIIEKRHIHTLNIIGVASSMIICMLCFEFEPFGLKKILSKISGGHGGDWLQFWGTYLGIIFSVVLTIYVTNRQGEIDRSSRAINIYIDNLMSAFDVLSDLYPLKNRCETYIKKAEKPVKNDILDHELALLIAKFKVEAQDKIQKLKNVVQKMPVNSKKQINESVEILNLDISLLDIKSDGENKHKNNIVAFKSFVDAYKLIEDFVTSEIDKYNKIE